MSNENKDDLLNNGQLDSAQKPDPDDKDQPSDKPPEPGKTKAPPVKKKKEKDNPESNPGLLTIEEHRQNLNIDAPVFVAVMQAQGWGAGKRIPEADFQAAVEAFLKAPMGGK